jgi:uncharacterized integral membrane protein
VTATGTWNRPSVYDYKVLEDNDADSTLSIFFWEISLSLALLIFFTMALGFVIGWFLRALLVYRKDKKEVAETQSIFRSDKK